MNQQMNEKELNNVVGGNYAGKDMYRIVYHCVNSRNDEVTLESIRINNEVTLFLEEKRLRRIIKERFYNIVSREEVPDPL